MPETSMVWTRRAVLLAGGLLATGCSGPRRPSIQSEDYGSGTGTGKRLRKVLERRAKALKDGDEKAYLADLDQSDDELVTYEKLVFSNLRQFELADVHYISDRVSERTLANGEVSFGPVVRVAKLTADEGPGDIAPGESFVYRFKDDVITGITPATRKNRKKLGASGPLADAPWHTDALKVTQVGEKIWLAGDRSVTDLDRYAAVAERELRTVEGLWGDRLTYPGYVLFFTRSATNFRQWFGLGTDDDFNARNLGYQVRLLGVRKDGLIYQGEYAASRIVVNLSNHKDGDPAATIRHELAHAVTARATMTDYGDWGPPIWAIEGFARYIETVGAPARASAIRAEVAAGVRAGKFRGAPPGRTAFYGRDISFNYALGSSVFSLAERLKGRKAAVELYAQIIKHPDSSGSFFELPIFDGMAREVLGISASAFRSRWNGFVRNGS
ncbi:hypothetical protein [Nonomuraea phyllanthi]|uniref:hypothetical protein n=1 Tax=Nonomuraea phyllanthi TaxID=2219224 RepID=UPI001292E3DA|nr:hypothetical protein [Nonomuraea phyllanthi]